LTSPTSPLAAELRRLRKEAGLSGPEAARRAGTTQPTISRAENGKVTPTAEVVEKLCKAYGAPVGLRRSLMRMAKEARDAVYQARTVVRESWRMQERIGQLENSAERIIQFAPTGVIGLVQTAAYATALFGDSLPESDRNRAVQARIKRQEVLNSAREFTFVHTEGALRWCVGSAAVMVEQMDRLAAVAKLSNVRIGVIPWGVPATLVPHHPWTRYDDRAALVGTLTATLVLSDQPNLDDYNDHWEELQPLIAWGDEAVSTIAKVRADFQALDTQ
jgi:transcriptional regulator with XRE-family HTH domain